MAPPPSAQDPVQSDDKPAVEQPGWGENPPKKLEGTLKNLASQAPKKKKKKNNNKKGGASKPTGFEEYAVDGPLTKEQVEAEQELYHPSKTFTERIETCVQKYRAKRKWDTTRLQIFSTYLALGGISTGPKQFFGGLDNKKIDEEEMDAEQIQQMAATDYVMEKDVSQGGGDEWEVDFAYVVRGFLSYKVPYVLGYQKVEELELAAKVIRNFLNYIVCHGVCPEYFQSIDDAKKICDLAETELPLCRNVSNRLPGTFNMACSTLFDGYYAGMRDDSQYTWDEGRASEIGLDPKVAKEIFNVCVAKRGTPKQQEIGLKAEVLKREYISMEVVGIAFANSEDPLFPEDDLEAPENKHCCGLTALGRLQVKTWVPEQDGAFAAAVLPQNEEETFEIWLEKEILQYCFLGMHLEARVHRLSSGLVFIDSVTGVMASFFLRLDTPDTKGIDDSDDGFD